MKKLYNLQIYFTFTMLILTNKMQNIISKTFQNICIMKITIDTEKNTLTVNGKKQRELKDDVKQALKQFMGENTQITKKPETCKNYNYWCGKLEHIKDCATCKFYKN